MTILKNTDRAEILRIVLTKSFEPRFNEVLAAIKQAVKDKMVKDHPNFHKAYADEAVRPYLATSQAGSTFFPELNQARAARPVFGKSSRMPTDYYHLDRERYKMLYDADTIVPNAMHEIRIEDDATTALYAKAWADYESAYDTLAALLNSYSTQEKLDVDFPEFAKHLPTPAAKMKLPAVIVKDVRKALSKLGVPAK